ncbi:MAG: glycoside hydrolase, partial [Actinomycetia bacterium]|nr:glycoside hydrolase [Actinomycetes bacterium]
MSIAVIRRTCVVAVVVLAGLVVPPGSSAFAEPLAAVPSPSPSPAFAPSWAHTALDADAPDPDVVRFGSTYYAYTTGTTWGNHVGVLTSTSPNGGWRTLTNGSTGSSAFPSIPAGASIQSWQVNNTQHAPGVFFWGGQYVMYYAAQTVSGHGGHYCLSVATASSPAGPFTDRSNGPWLCMDAQGGAIDPSPFVDPAGHAWLYFKTYDDINQSSQPSQVFAVPLSADGLGYGAPVSVLNQSSLSSPFETVENPQMVGGNGTFVLLYSRGQWNSSNYRMGYASCSGPTGPCGEGQPASILSSYGNVRGPGGGTAFDDGQGGWWLAYQGWQGASGCTTYSGTSCARQLFVAPMQLNAGQFGPGNCRADTTPKTFPDTNSTKGYWMLGADGGVFTFGSSVFYGSLPGLHIQNQSLAINSTRTGNGYWVLGKDGGVFSFGDAQYRGSVPGLHLGVPVEVVDMKRT